MASGQMLTVFCYDIARDKVRRRVAALLEEVAVRVQESVFEARMTARRAEDVAQRIGLLMDPGDQLRVYAVPSAAIRHCRVEGAGAPIEEQDFYLL
ncbi:CRISPR-associated endonuclease Cas2 [Falsiroseomonas sp.]|uniref:CRISPR-associated endonuclease Cas2 n=1 Tax=Falsiroseomonas sp. TaxID=2870721 RepID=UPI003F6F87CD